MRFIHRIRGNRRSQAAGRRSQDHATWTRCMHFSPFAAGRLATAVRFGNRLAPLAGRHLTGQKAWDGPTKTLAGAFYEPGDVVHLSLSRRDAASDSEAACGLRTTAGGMPIGPPPLDSRRAALRDGPYEGPSRGIFFLRAEGYSRRCCPPESVAAGRRI